MKPETEKWLAEVMASHTSHTSADKMVRRLCNLVTEQAEEIDELESLRSEANTAKITAAELVEAARIDCGVGTVPRIFRDALEARITAALRSETNRAVDGDEIRNFQDGIRDHLVALGVPSDRIDGAGCDSGDPLDFTKAEITQAFGYFENRAVEVVERKRDELSPVGIGAKVCNEILAELKGEVPSGK